MIRYCVQHVEKLKILLEGRLWGNGPKVRGGEGVNETRENKGLTRQDELNIVDLTGRQHDREKKRVGRRRKRCKGIEFLESK